MTAGDDPELMGWLLGVKGHWANISPAGDFLQSLAEAAMRADHENYPELRPVLLIMKARYQEYDPAPVRRETMSWTHAICVKCWNDRNPDKQVQHPMNSGSREKCCFCGEVTLTGLFVRHDPKELKCGGQHE